MGIVPQEPALFSGTLLENICFGLDSWDENDLFILKESVSSLGLITSDLRRLAAERRPAGLPSSRSLKLATSLLLGSDAAKTTDNAIIEQLRPLLLQSEDRINTRIEQLKNIAIKAQESENLQPEPDKSAATQAEKMLNTLATVVKARTKFSAAYDATAQERTVWIGGALD